MKVTNAGRDEPGWLIALAAFCGHAAASVGFLSIPLFAPALADLTGLNDRDFSFASMFVFLAVGISSPYTGALLRRFGSVVTMSTMLTFMAFGYLMLLGGTWTTAMIAGFLFGIGYGMFGPASATVVATRSPVERRGLYMAIRQSGVTFAGAMSGRLLPPLIVLAGWWAGVFAISGVMLLAAVLVLVFSSLFTILPQDIGEAAKPEERSSRNLAQRVMSGYSLPMPLQLFAFMAIGFAITHLGLASFSYFYLLEELHYSEIAGGTFISNVLIAATLGRPLMGWLADLTGSPVRVLAAIAVLGAVAFALLLVLEPTSSMPFIVVVSILAGISANTWTPIFTTAISNAAPPGKVGEYNGRAFSYAALGWTLAPPIIWGSIELSGGYTVPFAGLVVLELLMAAALFVMAPRIEVPVEPVGVPG